MTKTDARRMGDQWTPKTLMDACVHIRSLEAEISELRAAPAADEVKRLRGLFQDVIDDMTFNVAPSQATMAKIKEALK
jgi:hypothetical protein